MRCTHTQGQSQLLSQIGYGQESNSRPYYCLSSILPSGKPAPHNTHTLELSGSHRLCVQETNELPNPGRLLLHTESAKHPTPQEPPNESLMERLRLYRLGLIPSGPRAEGMTSPAGKSAGTPERMDRCVGQTSLKSQPAGMHGGTAISPDALGSQDQGLSGGTVILQRRILSSGPKPLCECVCVCVHAALSSQKSLPFHKFHTKEKLN